MQPDNNEFYAAIDLGSNSFHMVVATYNNDKLQIIDRIKESVRFAAGLNEQSMLTDEAMDRALKCLQRFGQRIREIPRINTRAVGTNTLRQARNSRAFLKLARATLGHPIEIIAGREEARLIFLGVARTVYNDSDRRLVVDIGGGSTELVIGQGFAPRLMESLYMGCVGVSQAFFRDDNISNKQMRRAMLLAQQELESIQHVYRKTGWDEVLGSSGTILAINSIVLEKGWCERGITAPALKKLREHMIEAGSVAKLDFAGLSESRRSVFAGGVAILSAVFDVLEIKQMSISDGALREGLLFDLIGRIHEQDVRDQSIVELASRYSVDMEQASRVAGAALDFFKQASAHWSLDVHADAKLLQWAAQTHEIGLAIAHAQHHKHAAYLLENSDMPGFSRQEQIHLSMLVRGHRRKFPLAEFETIPDEEREKITRLCLLLRIAVLLNRSRSYTTLPEIKLKIRDDDLQLKFPDQWLEEHPLTRADLDGEASYLSKTKYTFAYH